MVKKKWGGEKKFDVNLSQFFPPTETFFFQCEFVPFFFPQLFLSHSIFFLEFFLTNSLKKWLCHPLINVDAINARLDAVDDFKDCGTKYFCSGVIFRRVKKRLGKITRFRKNDISYSCRCSQIE